MSIGTTSDDRNALKILAETLFHSSLSAIPELLGGEGSWDRHPDLYPDPHVDSSLVVSYGHDVVEHGGLYARLTNRPHKTVAPTPSRIPADTAVLVLSSDQLTTRLFEHLGSLARARHVVGLIAAQTPQSLRRAVLIRGAALRLSRTTRQAPHPYPWIDVAPLVSCAALEAGGRRVLGADALSVSIRESLSCGAAVLRLASHGDSIDVFLGSHPPLCALKTRHYAPSPGDGLLSPEDRAYPPQCLTSGMCHRVNEPTFSALASGSVIGPDEIAARVLILDTCHGVPMAPPSPSPSISLLEELIGSPRVGAIVATPDYSFGSSVDLEDLARRIASGMALGDAIQSFQASGARVEKGRRVFLFGDPLFANPVQNLSGAPSVNAVAAGQPKSPQGTDDLSRLRALCPIHDGAHDTFQQVRAISMSGWVRWVEKVMTSATKQTWIEGAGQCPSCCGPVRHARIQGPSVGERRIVFCAGCGPRSDTQWARPEARLRSDKNGTLYLDTPALGKDWVGAAVLWGNKKEDHIIDAWPRAPSGDPASRHRPRTAPLTGLKRAGFVAIDDSWHVFSTPFQIPPP